MGALDDDILRAKELFEDLGGVSHRKMFGGAGLYADGVIFAVIVAGEFFIKADAALGAEIEAAGGARWVYDGKAKDGAAKQTAMPYWSLPPSALDDPEEAAAWARRSIVVARAAETRPKTRAKAPLKTRAKRGAGREPG